jgi:hypothetical protein
MEPFIFPIALLLFIWWVAPWAILIPLIIAGVVLFFINPMGCFFYYLFLGFLFNLNNPDFWKFR